MAEVQDRFLQSAKRIQDKILQIYMTLLHEICCRIKPYVRGYLITPPVLTIISESDLKISRVATA